MDPRLRSMLRRLRGLPDQVIGHPALTTLVQRLAREQQRSRFRREWIHASHVPHFTNFDYVMTEIAFGQMSAASLNRAFFTAELLRLGDRLLDIGCGDGFADRRFYSGKCSRIDAIDIEPTAIRHARARNAAANITYHLADAVVMPFPYPPYDVIVWDGAIGHFPPETTHRMLAKIRSALAPGGVFTGSESLGRVEGGYDHLTFFDDLDDMADLLRTTFPYVLTREATYRIGGRLVRREGYWRCGTDAARLMSPWLGAAALEASSG